MRVARLMLLLVLALVYSSRLSSQQTSSTLQRDPQAISLAQQSLAAMGGAQALSFTPLDETDLTGSTTNSTFNEYLFFGNQRIARRDYQNNVKYYFSDHLGTARIVASSSGCILDDSDFYPFGGERLVSSSSGNRYKFTSKERDSESGLDNFGARYHASAMGRFMSADPLYIELHRLADPQQLNLYAYARNNPLKFTDPTGLDITCTGARCADYLKALQKLFGDKAKLAYDKNGKVIVEGEVGKLKGGVKELMNAIDDKDHHLTINAVGGEKDSSVFFGASHGSTHTINFDQAALLDSPKNAGGMTSAQLVGHETLEGYDESMGATQPQGHNWAASVGFPGMDPLPGGTYGGQNGMVTWMTGYLRIQGTNMIESIGTQFVTPIPRADFLRNAKRDQPIPYPGYPVSVERKQ